MNSIKKSYKVEESLKKRFHKEIFSKFTKAISEYNLICPNDKIAVCVSGVINSMLLSKLVSMLCKHYKFHFDAVYILLDTGYSKKDLKAIMGNANVLNINLQILKSNPDCQNNMKLKIDALFRVAETLGCNKIALGENYNDIVETILGEMLYGAKIATLMPKARSNQLKGMELIRPLYLVSEADILRWASYNNLDFTLDDNFINADNSLQRKKERLRDHVLNLCNVEPQIIQNIFKSVENVNLATIIKYTDSFGSEHSFLDNY